MNLANYTLLSQDTCYVIIATSNFPTGAVAGYFYQRVGTNVAFMSGANVVPGQNTSNSNTGLALVNVYPNFTTAIPTDLVAQDLRYLAALQLEARVVHTVPAATGAGIYEGGISTVGPNLAQLVQGYYSYYITGASVASTNVGADLLFGFAYTQVNSAANPNGDIRGQLIPCVSPRRREVPATFVSTLGSYTGQLASTFRATQYGSDNNPNSYIKLNADPTTKNFDSYFQYQLPIQKGNIRNIRQLTLNINGKGSGSTWTFYFYNYVTKVWDQGFTYSPTSWTLGFYIIFDAYVANYVSATDVVGVRVTATAPTGPLYIDQLTIRPWAPDTQSVSNFRDRIKNFKVIFNF